MLQNPIVGGFSGSSKMSLEVRMLAKAETSNRRKGGRKTDFLNLFILAIYLSELL